MTNRLTAWIFGALALAAAAVASPAPAVAGSSCQYITTGAVLTAAQWNSCFQAKQNELGYTPVNKAGDGMQGLLTTIAPTVSTAGFRLYPGTAPSAPTNGDLWMTSAGLFGRVNGATVGPYAAANSTAFAATSPITVSFPSNVVTYAFDLTVANSWLATQTFRTLLAGTTNTYDVGTSATVAAFRTIYAGTSFVGPVVTATTSVAAGGCTIGTDALCVTGTTTHNGAVAVVGGSFGLSGNVSAAAWTTGGVRYKNVASTLTDTSSSGTVATAYTNVFGANTIAASSATTYTNYFNTYINDPVAGTNVTFTNKWALGADSAKFGTSNQLTISLTGVLTATSPVFTTPTLGVAAGTSLALGGCTIAANALCATGTVLFNSAVTMGAALTYGGVTLSNAVTGTGNMVLSAGPTFTGTLTASIGAFSSTLSSAAHTITSASATALAVGLNGATNPALQVDASTASSATGLKVKSAAAAAGLALSVITSGTNENLTIDAAAAGTITIGGTSTGAITLTRATTMSAALTYGGVTLSNSVTGTGSMVLSASPTLTGTITAAIANFSGAVAGASFGSTGAHTAYSGTAIPAGGTAGSGYLVSSTANFGAFFGSGAPTLSAAQGSLYIRSDGAPYYNSSSGSGTTWTSLASGSGTVTSVTCNGGLTGGAITTSGTCAVDIATTANIWAGTASKILDAANVFNGAGALTSCTGTSTAACDFGAGFNFTFTATTATNYTLGNPSNSTKVGQTGCIYLLQPASGTVVTIAFGSNWKSAGGTTAFALTATLAAVDRVCYIVRTSTFIDFSFANDIKT